MQNCEFSGRFCTSREGCKIVLKISTKSCIKEQKSPKHFWRDAVRGTKVVLSKKSVEQTEVVTSVLEEIRSKYFKTKLTKDGI